MKVINMYDVFLLSQRYGIPEKEVLLNLFTQDCNLSAVAIHIANKILYNL
jgi:hypothetical protein